VRLLAFAYHHSVGHCTAYRKRRTQDADTRFAEIARHYSNSPEALRLVGKRSMAHAGVTTWV